MTARTPSPTGLAISGRGGVRSVQPADGVRHGQRYVVLRERVVHAAAGGRWFGRASVEAY